jgi:hypothetical protein
MRVAISVALIAAGGVAGTIARTLLDDNPDSESVQIGQSVTEGDSPSSVEAQFSETRHFSPSSAYWFRRERGDFDSLCQSEG